MMTGQIARVLLFAGEVALLTEIATTGQRLSELLNDASQAHLAVQRAWLLRADNLKPSTVVPAASWVVRKSSLQAAAILAEPPSAAARRLAAYVPKTPARVAVMLPAVMVTGQVHVTGRADPARFILDGAERFVALTDAQVIPAVGSAPRAVSTVLIGRAHVIAAAAIENVQGP